MWLIVHYDSIGRRVGSADWDIYPDGWFVNAVYTGPNAKTDAYGALADFNKANEGYDRRFYIGEVKIA